jgi:hypothetical protein
LAVITLMIGSIAASAWASSEGKTTRGEAYVTGGTIDDERSSLRKDRKKFSLWVQTGASAGSAVPDSVVRITTPGGSLVLDTRMIGPWLFVDLRAGEYSVAVSAGGATETRRTFIHSGDHTEMVFFFDDSNSMRLPAASR